MADYMSREDYCEENCGKENREGYKTCTNCGMLNVPSSDVQPVKHGRWIWVKNYRDCEGDIYSQYKCSCCDFNVGGVYSIEDLTHFCGNCGARMNDDVNTQASIEAHGNSGVIM